MRAINGGDLNDTIGNQLRKESFLQLNRVLLFSSPDDGVIEPWVGFLESLVLNKIFYTLFSLSNHLFLDSMTPKGI
jgi:hypothetical protein